MILERKTYIKQDGEWINDKSWFLEYETYEYTTENVQLVTKLIQNALEPKFLSTQYLHKCINYLYLYLYL